MAITQPGATQSPTRPDPLAGVGGVRCDWLNITFDRSKLDEVIENLQPVEGTFVERFGGLHGYDHCTATSTGVVLAWSDGRRDALLSMPGGSASFNDVRELVGLIGWLSRFDIIRCSRIDLAFDDLDGVVNVSDFIEANRLAMDEPSRSPVCRFKHVGYYCTSDGRMAMYGRRGKQGGTRQVVVYDKAREQKLDGVHWSRIEVRFQNGGGDVVFARLAALVQGGATVAMLNEEMSARIAGSLEFREPGAENDRHLSRRPLCAWWQRILDVLAVPVRTSVVADDSHVEKMAAWIDRSVAPALVFIRDTVHALQMDFTELLLDVLDNNVDRARWDETDELRKGVNRARLLAAFNLPAMDGES